MVRLTNRSLHSLFAQCCIARPPFPTVWPRLFFAIKAAVKGNFYSLFAIDRQQTDTYELFFSDFLIFLSANLYLFCRKWYICRAKTELTCARLLDGCGFFVTYWQGGYLPKSHAQLPQERQKIFCLSLLQTIIKTTTLTIGMFYKLTY